MAGRPMAVQSLPEIFGQVGNIVLLEIFAQAQILMLLIKRIPTNSFLKIIDVLTDHCLTLILSDLTTIFGLLIKSRTNKYFIVYYVHLFVNSFLSLRGMNLPTNDLPESTMDWRVLSFYGCALCRHLRSKLQSTKI